MRKARLKYEGTFPQHVKKWGKYEDLAFYGILKSEYV
jgi:ribosomal-protein-alanine N-acetyltransferase